MANARQTAGGSTAYNNAKHPTPMCAPFRRISLTPCAGAIVPSPKSWESRQDGTLRNARSLRRESGADLFEQVGRGANSLMKVAQIEMFVRSVSSFIGETKTQQH